MQDSFCPSCGAGVGNDDNFCRKCGIAVRAALPALRQNSVPTAWQPAVSPVMKGAAVMAAGTVAQFLLRRVVGNVLDAARPRKRSPLRITRPRERDGMVDDAQIITEMVMMRRVRVRRPE